MTSGHYRWVFELVSSVRPSGGDGRRDGDLGALPKTWGAHQVQEDDDWLNESWIFLDLFAGLIWISGLLVG